MCSDVSINALMRELSFIIIIIIIISEDQKMLHLNFSAKLWTGFVFHRMVRIPTIGFMLQMVFDIIRH